MILERVGSLTSSTVMHSILILFQATTLNVAVNANNKALLTIMMSNNVSKMQQNLEVCTLFNFVCSLSS